MNRIISDTAEYGCYLFDHACKPLLNDFFKKIENKHIGKNFELADKVDNTKLIEVNDAIRKPSGRDYWKKIKSIHDFNEKNCLI